MNKDERSSQSVARKFLITNSKQLEQNKNAKFYKKNSGVSNRIFVKFINKILPRWRNYENSRVLPSMRSPDRSSSRIRTLLWNYLEDYKNCKVNCMNDSKEFQDAESVRSGNSHVTSQPGLFPKHPPFEGLWRPSFVSPRRTDVSATYLGYIWYIRKRFCKSTSFLFSSLSSIIELSLEENYRRTNSHVYCGEK